MRSIECRDRSAHRLHSSSASYGSVARGSVSSVVTSFALKAAHRNSMESFFFSEKIFAKLLTRIFSCSVRRFRKVCFLDDLHRILNSKAPLNLLRSSSGCSSEAQQIRLAPAFWVRTFQSEIFCLERARERELRIQND